MKKLLLFILFFLNVLVIGQTFSWVKQFKNSTEDTGENIDKIKKDNEGNFYISISCQNYLNPVITPKINAITIDAASQNSYGTFGEGLLIAKLDKNGNYLWSQFFSYLTDSDFDFDLHDNKIYVSYTKFKLIGNTAYTYSMITVLDNTGTVLRENEIANQRSRAITVDKNGNINLLLYIANSTLEFSDTRNQSFNYQESRLASILVNLNNNLKVQWIKKNNESFVNTFIVTDELNNTYFASNKTYASDFNLSKYSQNGDVIYNHLFTNQQISKISLDKTNNIVIAASADCSSTTIIDVDPSSNQQLVSCNTNNPFYILWLDPNGNYFDFREFRQNDQMVSANVNDLFSDKDNHLHISGSFGSMAHTASFDTDPHNNLTKYLNRQSGHNDGYSIELDENRNFKNSFKIGSYNNSNPNHNTRITSISSDTDSFYYVGNFNWHANLNPKGSPPHFLHAVNKSTLNFDGFFLKVSRCQTSPTVSSDPTVCPNSTIKLFASGGTAYSWTGPNGFSTSEQNPSITNASILNTGIYTCYISGTGDCDNSYSVNIKVEDITPPMLNILTLPNITGNCLTVITAIPTATDNCSGNIVGTTADPLQYSLPGNYIIHWIYDDGNGNVSTQNQNVIITSEPLPSVNAVQDFCLIDNPTISNIQITGTSIKWYDLSGTLLNTNTPLVDGTKYFATQTLNGCESAQKEISVNVNNPNPPTGNAAQDFCSAQNPTISNIIVTGQNIKWYDVSGNLLPPTTPLLDGQFYYGTQTVNSCESLQKIPVKVNVTNGGIPANDYAETFCNDTTSNTKTDNLNNYKGNLIANPGNYSFEFFDANNQAVPNPANADLNIGSNLFIVKVPNSLGCFVFVKLTLILNPKPILNLPTDVEFCNGQSATLNAGSGFASYEWSKDNYTTVISTDQILVVSEAGKYSVKVKNSFGCENVSSVNVTQSVIATIVGIQIVNNTSTVQMSDAGDFEYSLDNIKWQDSNVFKNLNNGSYTVFVKTKLGCIIGSMNFSIFNISNVFTPNADGSNDTWKISGMENYPGSEIQVFDRFGDVVFQKITNGTFEWNGYSNSRVLPTGNYWYVVKVSDGRLLNGWVLIKNRN